MTTKHSVSITAVSGILAQMVRPLVSLATIPLLLGQLGQAGLGVWLISLSIMGITGFVSAGLSAALITEISRKSSLDLAQEIGQLVFAATLIAAIWSSIALLILLPLSLSIDWGHLLNVGDVFPSDEIGRLMAVLAIMLSANLVAIVPRQVMVGRMHGYLAHLMDSCGIVAGAVGLVLALHFQAPLWGVGLAFMAPPVLTLLVGGLVYLHRSGLGLFSLAPLNRESFQTLWRESLKMSGYQLAYTVSSQSDLLLIGAILGAPASAAYGIAQRVFALPVMILLSVNYAQWPAFAKADAGRQHQSVTGIFRRTLILGTGGATGLAVIAALAYEPLVRAWLGTPIQTDAAILVGMVAWVIVATLVNTCDSLLRARRQTKFLMASMVRMAISNIAVTLVLLPLIGPAGAIWGSVAGFTCALLVPYLWRLRGDIGPSPTSAAGGVP